MDRGSGRLVERYGIPAHSLFTIQGEGVMEDRRIKRRPQSVPFLLAAVFTIIASIVPEILSNEIMGEVPGWLPYGKVTVLLGGGLLLRGKKMEHLYRYGAILSAFISMQIMTASIGNTDWWRTVFQRNTFAGNYGGNILLKVIGIIPVILLLIHYYRTTEEAFLGRGDLSTKAEPIRWLGIGKGKISWGKLSVISGILISVGTILLTVVTAAGHGRQGNLDGLFANLPLILLFALVNSFCEGVAYRSAVLATLSGILPKNPLILVGALLFGIGHYYGIPSGPLGALMSTVLGWYMLRSMYETKGFLSSWIIHFMQDAVIFATVIFMNGY